MDDLAGLDWSKESTTKRPQNATYNYNTSAFSTLKPTPPASGRATPLNTSSQPPSKPATPANDSFSNLVSFSNSTSSANLPLQEQQKRIAELKLQQQKKKPPSSQDQYSVGDDSFWNNLGSGRSTPAPELQRNGSQAAKPTMQEEDDIFAAFNAPVTNSQKPSGTKIATLDDEDDPFELSKVKPRRAETPESREKGFDDDDVLGLLGQPVPARNRPGPELETLPSPPSDANPRDRAFAELVDMGFSAEKARSALDTTESGADVQAAVGWLLNQAHQEARDRSQSRDVSRNGHSPAANVRTRGTRRIDPGLEQWQEQQNQGAGANRKGQEASSEAKERDPSQVAQEFGANFLKTANSLWRQGQKKVQQAVQEFNSDSESNQPKWMQQPDRTAKAEARSQQRGDEAGTARRRRRSSQAKAQQSATDEAMMLEAERPTPPPRQPPRSRAAPQLDSSADNSRDHSPAVASRLRERHPPQPAFLRQPQPQKPVPQPSVSNSRAALSRQATDDQAAQAYVSSARRRKPTAQAPVAASESDLLEGSSRQHLPPKPASSRSTHVASPKPASITVRPTVPPRNVPSISSLSLKASHAHREKGNDHFKRGDYSSAHQAYTTSVSHLPSAHPITVILLTNRALTALKIGEPKTAITDCDNAISIIGISKGESEQIDLSNGEPPKPMREYYGKALMRKAEALEQMEKWPEAAAVWREAVEGGHGGATSMQGRLRAEKAANPQARPKPRPPVAKKPPPRQSALTDLAGQDSRAVSALRAANAAAEKADDEKFALYDSVDLRIKTWRDGKLDNLRALLGSLDTVLWEGSGWKKIGMADLVLPGKVKVQYMKGIGKVHPDKIPTDATTEQRMISSAVFSTLNEAWDKFKNENGL